jgi:hypothetical protein
MRWPCLAALFALGVSGCAGAEPGAPEPTDGPRTDDGVPAQTWFHGTFQLYLSSVDAGSVRQGVPPPLGLRANNCLALPEGLHILRGWANATWTPQTTVVVSLVAVLDYGPGERRMAEGASPLSLDVSGLTLGAVQSLGGAEGGDGISLLMVDLTGDASVALEQPVKLALDLLVENNPTLAPGEGYTCSPFT